MNKKLIFRILGALAGALIIVGCFVPFISAYGSSISLWTQYGKVGTLYLPIMIIVFGVIAVVFFSLNIKTEFAYMTTGAVLFYVIMETVNGIDLFEFFSVGYYFLAIGSILTGVMAFLCNLKSEVKTSHLPIDEKVEQPSMVQQIDKLYNEQQSNTIEEIPYQINSEINPLPIQPLQPTISPVDVAPVNLQEVNTKAEQESNQMNPLGNNTSNVPVNPVIQQFTQSPVVPEVAPVQPTQVVPSNNVQPQTAPVQNNVVEPTIPVSAPTIAEEQTPIQPNPVVSSFVTPEPNSMLQNPNANTQSTILAPQQPTNNNSGLDIFGQ